jgi:hypothetical protein
MRQLSKQERLREEERQRATRTKRITIISIIAVGVLALAVLVSFVVRQSQSPTRTTANAAYPPTDSISCDTNEHADIHIHAHITMYINGQRVPVPGTIGIAPDSSCLYWLHTHSNDGVIHIEAPAGQSFILGNFLDIWGKRYLKLGYPNRLDQTKGWQVYVDGKPFAGDFHTIPLHSHALITLAYHSPAVPPDTNYHWNGL